MTKLTLRSPKNTIELITKLFLASPVCTISIREDRAFAKSGYLELGKIELFPLKNELESCTSAVLNGAFEWQTPDVATATEQIIKCLDVENIENPNRKQKAEDKIRRIVDLFGSVPVRLGLSHPIFDPYAFKAMPFRRPTTIVSDTTGVLQGGLNFVSQFLFPAARIKVPAIVQMEIVNFADRFLKNRRLSNVKPLDLLMDHIISQAGQRVLLQLELHSDIELERTFLFGDPLRDAFQSETDQELKDLNFSASIPSYVDRLILEAARKHQAQVATGHPVMLLTSDQGLARMTMAEGMHPLYFRVAHADRFFGKILTGTNLHPFTGKLCTTSVPNVLWELATIFGSARLSSDDGGQSLLIHAIGEKLNWVPYHSHDDLLWVEFIESSPSRQVNLERSVDTVDPLEGADTLSSPKTEYHSDADIKQPHMRKSQVTKRKAQLYKFSLNNLITLVDMLEIEQRLSAGDIMAMLGIHTKSGLNDYRQFLVSGDTITVDKTRWFATPTLTPIAIALRNGDISELRKALNVFPSYEMLEQDISELDVGSAMNVKLFGRAVANFLALAEITELGAPVHGRGFFVTPNDPTDKEFADISLSAYAKLEQGREWIATGSWFEELILSNGIHPVVARRRLQAAHELGFIRRLTEGSTTETGFDRHQIKVLAPKDGKAFVKTEYLYRGDFLIPGKSSSSLKIEKIEQ